MACDNQGVPLHLVAARANDHDSPLLEPTLAGIVDMIGPLPQYRGGHGEDLFPTVHLDRGYNSSKTRDLLETLGFAGEIATKGVPAPIQAGRWWPAERTHSWMNGYGKLRRFTDKRRVIVEFYLKLAAALTVIRRLINQARTLYRWPASPPPADSADHQLPGSLSLNPRSGLIYDIWLAVDHAVDLYSAQGCGDPAGLSSFSTLYVAPRSSSRTTIGAWDTIRYRPSTSSPSLERACRLSRVWAGARPTTGANREPIGFLM